jgi:hypothetical protein
MKDKTNIKRYVKLILGDKINWKQHKKRNVENGLVIWWMALWRNRYLVTPLHYRFFGMEKEQYYGRWCNHRLRNHKWQVSLCFAQDFHRFGGALASLNTPEKICKYWIMAVKMQGANEVVKRFGWCTYSRRSTLSRGYADIFYIEMCNQWWIPLSSYHGTMPLVERYILLWLVYYDGRRPKDYMFVRT